MLTEFRIIFCTIFFTKCIDMNLFLPHVMHRFEEMKLLFVNLELILK